MVALCYGPILRLRSIKVNLNI